MTTKSIVLTAVAAAGMVANAEVWDIKFSLKTVGNNKKTSVKIVGAYDDSTAGKYSFWYDKGAALKNVEFATDNVTSYGRSNKAQNAQLVWGDVSSPDGILIAGGFGSARSTSGQVAGVLDGVPASGTWTMKRSRKTFDALAKQAADVAANLAQEAAVKAYLDGAKSAAEVMAGKAETDAKIAELTADAEKTAAELATAKADVEAAAAKVAAAEADAKAAADKVAAAQADAAAVTEANEELKKAIADLEAKTNTLSKAVANLANVTNSVGLAEKTRKLYKQDVEDYITYSLEKAGVTVAELDKNVTNAYVKATNNLAKAQKELAVAETRLADMNAYDQKNFDAISYAVDLDAVSNRYAVITNNAFREAVLKQDTATIEANAEWNDVFAEMGDIVDSTNTAYTAWMGKDGAYQVYTNAYTNLLEIVKELEIAEADLTSAGESDTAEKQTLVNNLRKNRDNQQKTVDAYATTNELKKAAFDDAKKVVDDFVAKKDIDACVAEMKDLEDELAKFKKECGGYIIDTFHDEIIPGQEKAVSNLTEKVDTCQGDVDLFDGDVLISEDPLELSQAKWNEIYKANVTDQQATVADKDELLAIKLSNIKAEQDLAKILNIELNTDEFVKGLEEKFKEELKDETAAPVVVSAAKDCDIELKPIKE